MSEFNKDDYLNDLPDPDQAAEGAASAAPQDSAKAETASQASSDEGAGAAKSATEGETPANAGAEQPSDSSSDSAPSDSEDTLTPLGKAKKEAADYLEALQRERAEFINYRNRTQK